MSEQSRSPLVAYAGYLKDRASYVASEPLDSDFTIEFYESLFDLGDISLVPHALNALTATDGMLSSRVSGTKLTSTVTVKAFNWFMHQNPERYIEDALAANESPNYQHSAVSAVLTAVAQKEAVRKTAGNLSRVAQVGAFIIPAVLDDKLHHVGESVGDGRTALTVVGNVGNYFASRIESCGNITLVGDAGHFAAANADQFGDSLRNEKPTVLVTGAVGDNFADSAVNLVSHVMGDAGDYVAHNTRTVRSRNDGSQSKIAVRIDGTAGRYFGEEASGDVLLSAGSIEMVGTPDPSFTGSIEEGKEPAGSRLNRLYYFNGAKTE